MARRSVVKEPSIKESTARRRRSNPRRNPLEAPLDQATGAMGGSVFDAISGLGADYIQAGIKRGLSKVGMSFADGIAKRVISAGDSALENALRFRQSNDEDSALDQATGLPKWLSDALKADYNVFAVIGKPGSGKTVLAFAIAEVMRRPVFMVDAPEAILRSAPKNMVRKLNSVSDAKLLPAGSIILLDDAQQYISSRKFMSGAALDFEELVFTGRHRGLTLIVTAQSSNTINMAGLQATILWLKEPLMMYQAAERDVLKPIIELAMSEYKAMPQSDWKRYVFAYRDPGHAGMVPYSPPDWYTNKISRYRAVTGRTVSMGDGLMPEGGGETPITDDGDEGDVEGREQETTPQPYGVELR